MKRLKFVKGVLVSLVLSLLMALALGGTADAARRRPDPRPYNPVRCDTFLYNGPHHGAASCWGGRYGGSARIHVACSAWWDHDVTGDWVRVPANARRGYGDGLGGHCWSNVARVWVDIGR